MISRRQFLSSTVYSSALVMSSTVYANWNTLPAMPLKVQEIYPALFRNQIVVAGGLYANEQNQLSVSDRVIGFDINNEKWMWLHQLPEPRHHPFLVVFDDQLFAFSGFTISERGIWTASRDVLMLDHNQGQWHRSPFNMPYPMCETVATTHANKIHLVSGRKPVGSNNGNWSDHSDIASHQVFEPKTGVWQCARPIPTARNSACSAQVGKRWFVIGGRTVEGGNLATNEVYDFEKDSWQKVAPMPQAQGGLAAQAIGHYIYVFGGEHFNNGGGVYKKVWRYDTIKDVWNHESEMPLPRHGLGAVAVKNRIYLIGGAAKAGGNETTNHLSVFEPDRTLRKE
ncbi:MAG: galactose oxidase [Gammaproteobacteria bacterium]|nr:galactose oxidase [Gammaproteobacteria bacterium]